LNTLNLGEGLVLRNRLKAERAWFLSVGEESGAWNRAGFDSLGQRLRVIEEPNL